MKEVLRSIKILKNRCPAEMEQFANYLHLRFSQEMANLVNLKKYEDIRYTQGYVTALTTILKLVNQTDEMFKEMEEAENKSRISGI